jgi:4,5-DOPA dioxygenase extradiol
MSKIIHTKSNNPGSMIYLPHGGGPWPLLGDHRHLDLIDFLKDITSTLIQPSAILMISAHWETDIPTVTSGESPGLIYDYRGFPEQTYSIKYPAPGYPLLAEKIVQLLEKHSIPATTNDSRGFDHGFFVPLKLMYPEAVIPCVQLSLLDSLDPVEHIRLGKALADLQEDNLLIIGSGASFHNLRAFHEIPTMAAQSKNEAFEQWLIETLVSGRLTESERMQRLENWELAPAARYCHPREEHLLPLHVCCGIASAPAERVIEVEFLGKKASAYIW